MLKNLIYILELSAIQFKSDITILLIFALLTFSIPPNFYVSYSLLVDLFALRKATQHMILSDNIQNNEIMPLIKAISDWHHDSITKVEHATNW